MKISHRGKDRELVTVGPSLVYDFRSIRDALDSIVDAAADNPYTIAVSGIHRAGEGSIPSGPIYWDKSFVSLVGEPGAMIERDEADGHATATGGTIQIANEDGETLVEQVSFSNIRIRRSASGAAAGAGGGAPEAALFIGKENVHPDERNWDFVEVDGCLIEGIHDGIQWFGTNYMNLDRPPRLRVTNNTIICAHDASTSKGQAETYHAHNRIYCDSAGFDWYPNPNDWKTTGFHYGMERGGGVGTEVTAHPDTRLVMHGDQIHVVANTNIASEIAGILFYDPDIDVGVSVRRLRVSISNVQIYVNHVADAAGTCGGIVLLGHDTAEWEVGTSDFDVHDVSIRVHTAVSSQVAAGVWLEGANTATTREIFVSGQAHVTAPSGTAYSMRAVTSGDTINHRMLSDQATSVGAGAAVTQQALVA